MASTIQYQWPVASRAMANSEGKQLLPDSVLKIRDQADAQKLA